MFGFGLHRRRTFGDVVREYPENFLWGIRETTMSPMLKEFLAHCNNHIVFRKALHKKVEKRRIPLAARS